MSTTPVETTIVVITPDAPAKNPAAGPVPIAHPFGNEPVKRRLEWDDE